MQLRAYIRWTTPLYALFFAAGLYASHFVLQTGLTVLVAVLAAFAVLDAAVVTRIHRLEAHPIRTAAELLTTQQEANRLSRMVVFAGAGLGVAFLLAFVWIVQQA